MKNEYLSGSVDQYDDRMGYGYIKPDEPGSEEERFLVHRRSLRIPGLPLSRGDRVIFKLEVVPRGLLAADVHFELLDPDSDEIFHGAISSLQSDRGFGFIADDNDDRIFFHFAQLADPDQPPPVGTAVSFNKQGTDRGMQAFRVTPLDTPIQSTAYQEIPKTVPQKENYLEQAILARYNKRLDEAAKLYEKGLAQSPSVQLITSYASMEKNRNRRADAIRVYEQGLLVFPNNIKLFEDAGLLAASMGEFKKALDLLSRGLALSQKTAQRGDRIFLLAIARIHARRDNGRADLEEAWKYYNQAKEAFASSRHGKAAFPRDDLLVMDIVSIRLQHYRGGLAYDFLNKAGFKPVRAALFEQKTVGADFIVEPKNADLLEGYGVAGNILLRCLFKSGIARADISDIDKVVHEWGTGGVVDEQVVLLLVASLPEGVERLMFQRLEDRKRTVPAIVPITQSQIETAGKADDLLREVLDRWLYRRDLFAQNFPVSGRRFFGRERSLAEIRDAIANGTAAGIFGLRKVGKTSLLKEIERRANEGGDIAIYIDLLRIPADITDTRWLYWKLGRELVKRTTIRPEFRGIRWRLGNEYNDYLDIPDKYPVATAFDSDLSRTLDVIRRSPLSPRPKVIVMLDEIERLLPNTAGKEGFKGFFDFVSYIRGVAQESSDFVPIVTGANAAIAEAAQFSGKDNPVFNFFREIYLPLLKSGESIQMVQTLGKGMGIRFSTEVALRIHSLTGGHPFFIRQFCSYLCARYPERPLTMTVTKIDDWVDAYLEIAGRDFSEIVERFSRDYPDELDVCLEISRGKDIGLHQLTRKLPKTLSLRHLIGYQIVEISDNKASLTMGLMQRWLQSGRIGNVR
ncbi:cold shock domain-containing protein [Accumulibacter sp.]|uniref:Cold-shock DNA-binding domain protein n=1 Tax=Accumulibacter regalis TaxID=522306 RepID=C7RR43_ACCRE|nr:cold shock domain-containing protein [Accumulibacter sp.]MBN8495325.1 cold shock domain-containing protein [Accumulibacter sp.]MBO3715682.1 cold shock domain-containing protein [Accumulibacter sp.]